MKQQEIKPDATVRELWLEMIGACAPTVLANPTGIQYREMERAFYSGFSACLIHSYSVANQLSEAEAMKVLDRLGRELDEFMAQQMVKLQKGGNQN